MTRTTFLALAIVVGNISLATADKPSRPAQVAILKTHLETLQKQEADAFLTVSEKGGDASVQLTNGKKTVSLNIAYYPSKQKPAIALKSAGVTIPATWKQVGFDPGSFVAYEIPAGEIKDLPQFIHDIFIKFFKRKADYSINCTIEQF